MGLDSMPPAGYEERRALASRAIAKSPHYLNLIRQETDKQDIAPLFIEGRNNREIGETLHLPGRIVSQNIADIMRFVHRPRVQEIRSMLQRLHQKGTPIHELPPEEIAELLGTARHDTIIKALKGFEPKTPPQRPPPTPGKTPRIPSDAMTERYGTLEEHYLRALKNPQALADFLDRITPHVRRGVGSVTTHPDNSEDLTQEALIKIIKNFEKITNPQAIVKLAYTIGRHTALDDERDNRGTIYTGLAGQQADENTSPYDHSLQTPGAEEEFFKQHGRQEFLTAIERLPPSYRTILTLRHLEEYTYEEIARTLKIPKGTVKSRMNRAHAALKQSLSPSEDPHTNRKR